MSFTCGNCNGVLNDPGSRPIKRVTAIRQRPFHNGTEVVKEIDLCGPCANKISDIPKDLTPVDQSSRNSMTDFQKNRNRK